MSTWPTSTELSVLQILQDNPAGAYGLQIVESSSNQIKRGSVYVLLGRLEEKGFVKVTKPQMSENEGGLPRPIYRITGLGTKALAAAESIGLRFVGA